MRRFDDHGDLFLSYCSNFLPVWLSPIYDIIGVGATVFMSHKCFMLPTHWCFHFKSCSYVFSAMHLMSDQPFNANITNLSKNQVRFWSVIVPWKRWNDSGWHQWFAIRIYLIMPSNTSLYRRKENIQQNMQPSLQQGRDAIYLEFQLKELIWH